MPLHLCSAVLARYFLLRADLQVTLKWISQMRSMTAIGAFQKEEWAGLLTSLFRTMLTHVQPTFVHFTVNLEMTELRGMLIFNICSLIGSRHTANAFSRPPPHWVEISWCIRSWHPLCPHSKDTGLFISYLLRNRTRFHQQWQVAKKYLNSFYSFRST